MITYYAMLAASKPPKEFNLQTGAAGFRALALIALVIVGIIMVIRAVLKHGASGDIHNSANVFGATLICLATLGLFAGAGVAMGYGTAMLNTLTALLT